MDTLKETVLLVHKALEHGAGTTGKEIAAAIAEIAAALSAASKGVKPVAACTLTEWRAAEEAGGVVCLECGETVQALGSHALKAHGLSWTAYTERWNWWADDNGVTLRKAGAALSAKRRDTALMIGLGAKGQQKGYVKPEKAEEAKPAAPATPATPVQPKRMTTAQMKSCAMEDLLEYCNDMEGVNDKEWDKALSIYWERHQAEKAALGLYTPPKSPEEQQAEIEAFDKAINLK